MRRWFPRWRTPRRLRKAQSIIGQSTAQVARESGALSAAANTAKLARGAGAAIPVVFAAWDIIDAWGDYQETMQTVR